LDADFGSGLSGFDVTMDVLLFWLPPPRVSPGKTWKIVRPESKKKSHGGPETLKIGRDTPHVVIQSSETDASEHCLPATMRKAVLFCSRVATVMTAALVGKPVVGVGTQMEQVANLASLERQGFAIRVGKSRDPSAKIQVAIEELLHDDAAKATAFAGIVAQWDGPRIAAEKLLEPYGSGE
jgi:hypothetical protein